MRKRHDCHREAADGEKSVAACRCPGILGIARWDPLLCELERLPMDSNGSFVPFTKIRECSTSSAMQNKSNTPDITDQTELPDLDRALVEAAEEMSFDWPEFLAVERFRPGITEFALNSLLVAGLIALGGIYILFFTS
jgi:hypothetical protein